MQSSTLIRQSPIPLRPQWPTSLGRAPAKAAFALAASHAGAGPALGLIRGSEPVDRTALSIVRAAVSGMTTGDSEELIHTASTLFLAELQTSAASGLIRLAGGPLPLGENGQISVPGVARGSITAGLVNEGAPIPVRRGQTTGLFITLAKLGVIVVLSHELLRNSNGERLFSLALEQAGADAVDAFYFAATPGGLLDGVVATVSLGDPLSDFAQLARAVGEAGSGGPIAFATGRGRAAELSVRSGSLFAGSPPPIFGSAVLSDDQLVAVDALDVLHGVGPIVEIETGDSTALVMRDDPTNIGVPPNVAAAPTQSMWQTAQLAQRMLVDCGFVRRRSDAVALVSPINWSTP